LPKPLVDCSAVVTGKENKVAFRFVSVTLTTSGDLNVVASGGKFTHVSFDGMIAYVC
jgi:type 1 fimbria pilin